MKTVTTTRWLVYPALAMVMLGAPLRGEATDSGLRYVDLDCDTNTTRFADAAPEVGNASETTTGTDVVDSSGVRLDSDGPAEAWCQWTVPSDYDGSEHEVLPQLWVSGWATSCVVCAFNCGNSRPIKLDVSSRSYSAGQALDLAHGTVDTQTLNFSTTSCASPCEGTCYPADILRQAEFEPTDATANWQPDDVVFIRIERDTGVENNLPVGFHISRVRLKYKVVIE